MPEGLKIQVEADVQKAVKALSQEVPQAADKAGDALQTLGGRVKQSTNGLKNDLPQSVDKSRASILKLIPPISKLGDSLETLRGKLGAKQSFLNVEKDAAKIAILNKEIAALNSEIKRVESIGTAGFGAVGKGANTAFSAVRQFAYVLPGIGIAGIIGGLSDMVVGLFQTSSAFDKASLSAEIFKDNLDDIKAASDRLQSFLDLQTKIADLKFRIGGGTGAAADINNFNNELKANNTLIKDAEKNLTDLNNTEQKIVGEIKKVFTTLSKVGVKNPLLDLALQGKDLTKITKEEADKLPPVLKVLANQFIENRKAILDYDKIYTETTGANTLLRLQIENASVEEQRRLREKALADYEKYVNSIISKATKVSNAFKDIIDLQFEPGVLDSQSQVFAQAQDFLNKFAGQKFKFKQLIGFGDIQIPPEDVKPVATEFGVMFSKELNAYFKSNTLFDPSIALAQTLEAQRKAIGGIFGIQSNEDSIFTKAQREAIVTAQTIQSVLTPAFQDLFNAILEGENPLKAFFSSLAQSVAQLIQKLISAAITAAILSAIFPAGLGGAKGFGSIFGKVLGFAQGGLVYGPTLGLIGEGRGTSQSNPEVIAPLDQLQAMLGDVGGGRQVVTVTGRLRGNDMILQNARTSRAQGRAGVR